MSPTNVHNPEYFHKVVDCQWACPAHTNVPEYIRLIAQGRYADAYMLNRESNVFPGILGRTCDRPCEPACRRGRVEEKPVAICRLKRVAADLREDVSDRLPKAPAAKNGKRVALVGAGPASLVVANDLVPLGYAVTVFEALPAPGGLMRSNIPSFRLPEQVLNEEIDMILGMGVDVRYATRIESMRVLLAEGYDAVFVGTGAPRGKDLDVPGRKDAAANVHIGIDWLQSIAFGHVDSIGKRVLIIGVGNTAMDCCRSAARLGGTSIKVMARKPRKYFKASPWELEDAEEERVEIVVDHEPKAFVVENGKLLGMEFQRYESSEGASGRLVQKPLDVVFVPADDVILALGQENAFPWIERDLGIDADEWGQPVVDPVTFQSTRSGVFFGGDAAFGPKNIIWAAEHGHQAAISIDNHCQGVPVDERLPRGMNLVSTKMGLHEWAYKNDYNPGKREKMTHVDLVRRFEKLDVEVEVGFSPEQAAREVERCLNCDVQTVFADKLCIECDACIDVCPVLCLTITPDGAETDLRGRLSAPALDPKQDLFVSGSLPQTGRVMVKDEDLCVHCGLCAERCPTAAWDMQKFDLVIPYAGKRACSARR
ncbi:MAG: FAD-dependent oxidoreductase [Deltaproteobacteria bacterium]|nr:FAD-dependent oxidoreductase [Deltaproteobacteria bacterium]